MLKRWFVFVAMGALGSVSAQNDAGSAFEITNYGKLWNAWSNASRSIYLVGFVDGYARAEHAVFGPYLSGDQQREVAATLATLYDDDDIRDVMTSLYSDPANAYIRFDSMIYIARDKLSGKDTETTIRRARETDRGYHRK